MQDVVVQTIAEVRGVTRRFHSEGGDVQALRGVTLKLLPGEFMALRGRSGSGKTTLLNIMVGLDDPGDGQAFVLEKELGRLNEAQRAKLRRESIGTMFQNAHLFPSLTAQENVEVPLWLARIAPQVRTKLALAALEQVGLKERSHHRGLELSGGEQQRVSLARALVHKPRFIIADEPTGNLDTSTGRDIVALLRELTHRMQIGLLVATHDPMLFAAADRVVQIQDGLISEV